MVEIESLTLSSRKLLLPTAKEEDDLDPSMPTDHLSTPMAATTARVRSNKKLRRILGRAS